METTENLECARNEEHAVGTVVGSKHSDTFHVAHHEGPCWGTAFSCDLLCPVNALTQVCYQCCIHVPRYQINSICWDLRDLSSYSFYQMVAFTFKYHDGNVICQIFCVGSENTWKLKTFLLLYWKPLL